MYGIVAVVTGPEPGLRVEISVTVSVPSNKGRVGQTVGHVLMTIIKLWYTGRFFRQTSINHLPYGVCVTLKFAIYNLRFHLSPFSQTDFTLNFLPEKFRIPVQFVICFHRTLVPIITCFQ